MEEHLVNGFDCAGKKSSAKFLFDDGRPCVNHEPQMLLDGAQRPDNLVPYFRAACEYARKEGGLQILFVTPHTKAPRDPKIVLDVHTMSSKQLNSQDQANTPAEELVRRHAYLADMNGSFNGDFLCGMGQEASSISAGNHLGIFGQMAMHDKPAPVLFPAGDFKAGFSEVKKIADSGRKVILQFNHPGALRDITGMLEVSDNKKRSVKVNKEYFNDYGIDDVMPGNCAVLHKKRQLIENLDFAKDSQLYGEPNTPEENKRRVKPQPETAEALRENLLLGLPEIPEECAQLSGEDLELTQATLKKTYANIRAESGDRFRLMELFYPHGATSNQSTDFHPSHERTKEKFAAMMDDAPSKIHLIGPNKKAVFLNHVLMGAYNYIYYLNMGFKIGPTANQDNHMMNWGAATANRTGVLAPNLKEKSVLDSLDNRRTFATEDRDAKVLFAADSGGKTFVMGDEGESSADSATLRIGYQDPGSGKEGISDDAAGIRVYYYHESDDVKFPMAVGMQEVQLRGKPEPKFDEAGNEITESAEKTPKVRTVINGKVDGDPSAVARFVDFSAGGELGKLPSGPAEGDFANEWTSSKDPVVTTGTVRELNIPLKKGSQFFFVEITQKGDLDRIYTAPIWITKK